MKCKNCGCELDNESLFCKKCGTKCEDIASSKEELPTDKEALKKKILGGSLSEDNKTQEKSWQDNLSFGKVILILLVMGGIVLVTHPDIFSSSHEDSVPPKQTVQQEVKKEPPPYTTEDALKELAWYENRLSEYVQMKSMDYTTAMKAAGELYVMWNEIQEVYNKKSSEESVKTAYLKLQKTLPKAQQNIYPKIRKAWVQGTTADMARENVRLSCRNASCNEINLKSVKYLNVSAVQEEMDGFQTVFDKIRMRKIWFHDTFGSGTHVTRQDVSDGSLE